MINFTLLLTDSDHCGEPETEVGAKFHMHQAGQRSLNEYEAKAGS